MSKYVEELHNTQDAKSLMDALALFFGICVLLGFLGVVFWSVF